MLNASQQSQHTLKQLHVSLLSMVNEDPFCRSNPSTSVPESCDQLMCDGENPVLTLACNIEHRVLPRLANLIVLLRSEVSQYAAGQISSTFCSALTFCLLARSVSHASLSLSYETSRVKTVETSKRPSEESREHCIN
jgi:hypothetical protein